MRSRPLLLLTLLLAGGAWAQEPPSTAPTQATGQTSLSLADAFKMALERNPNVSVAELSRLTAEIQASRARLDRFQAGVDLSSSWGYSLVVPFEKDEDAASRAVPTPTSATSTTTPEITSPWLYGSLDYGAQASVTVPLYTGGATQARIDRAELGVELAQLQEEQVRRSLERAVFTSYWTIKGYELQLAAAQESLDVTREALKIISAKADAGLAAPLDVNRSRVDLISQEAQVLTLQGEMYQAQIELLRLLQLPEAPLALTDPLRSSQSTLPETADPLVELARQQRPELTQLALERGQTDADRRLARAARSPQVALQGGATFSGAGESAHFFQEELEDYNQELTAEALNPDLVIGAGIGLSWNVFDLGKTRDSVRVAQLTTLQVDARTAEQESAIRKEVQAAWRQVQTLRARAPLVDSQVELARDNLQIIQALYAQGSASLLDLFDAQSAYRSANSQRASFQVNLILAEYELQWTIGTRLAPEAP